MIGLRNIRQGEVAGWIRGIVREEIDRENKLKRKRKGFKDFIRGIVVEVLKEEKAAAKKVSKASSGSSKKKGAAKTAVVVFLALILPALMIGCTKSNPAMAEGPPLGLINPRNVDSETSSEWNFQSVKIDSSLRCGGTFIYAGESTSTGPDTYYITPGVLNSNPSTTQTSGIAVIWTNDTDGTGASTLSVDGYENALKDKDGNDTAAGDITDDDFSFAIFDGVNSCWKLINR